MTTIDMSKIGDATATRCEAQLRWRKGVLQQLWAIISYRDGRPYERTWQWRDVPIAQDDGSEQEQQ